MIVTGYFKLVDVVYDILCHLEIQYRSSIPPNLNNFTITFKSKEDMWLYLLHDNNRYISAAGIPIDIICKVE